MNVSISLYSSISYDRLSQYDSTVDDDIFFTDETEEGIELNKLRATVDHLQYGML